MFRRQIFGIKLSVKQSFFCSEFLKPLSTFYFLCFHHPYHFDVRYATKKSIELAIGEGLAIRGQITPSIDVAAIIHYDIRVSAPTVAKISHELRVSRFTVIPNTI